MRTFLREIRETIAPDRDSKHGPLPPLLIAMTLVTGLVDAFSYLALGHVFVANMTGNVVFLGFALAGAQGFSIPASLVARRSPSAPSSVATLTRASATIEVTFLPLLPPSRPSSLRLRSCSLP
jgi:hypothetical protein